MKLFCDYDAEMNHQGKVVSEAVIDMALCSNVYIIISLTFQKGWTPLMEAARKGFKDVVNELAKRGADINIQTVRTN